MRLESGGVLMLGGLVAALAIDMATGAFFQDAGAPITEWGFYIGVPLFGFGLGWVALPALRAAAECGSRRSLRH